MNIFRKPSPGHLALLLVLVALLLLVCLAVYLFLMRVLRRVDAAGGPGETAVTLHRKLTLLLAVVLCAILLILMFVVGAYLLLRVGREVAHRRVGGQPTQYVDAWSRYRLSAEQIEAATREEGRNFKPPDEPGGPADSPPDSPHDPNQES